jgi:hypothetical protein
MMALEYSGIPQGTSWTQEVLTSKRRSKLELSVQTVTKLWKNKTIQVGLNVRVNTLVYPRLRKLEW